MINMKHRFHGHGSLRYVYKNGDIARSRNFIVKTTVNPRRDHSRFAVVISKKTLKSAVGRNRVRRRVYEVLRHEIDRVEVPRDIVVIVVSAEVRDMPYDQLAQSLIETCIRAGIYKTDEKSGILSLVTTTDKVESSTE